MSHPLSIARTAAAALLALGAVAAHASSAAVAVRASGWMDDMRLSCSGGWVFEDEAAGFADQKLGLVAVR